MNITETRLPQDGAIKGRIDGTDPDMRVICTSDQRGRKSRYSYFGLYTKPCRFRGF